MEPLWCTRSSEAPVEPPSSDSRYQCRGGPHAKPVRYFLFPRSELNSFLGQPYNRVYEAAVTPGRIDVSVEEASGPRLLAIYRLSIALLPESVGSRTPTGRPTADSSTRDV